MLTHACPIHEPAWLASPEFNRGHVGQAERNHALVEWGHRIRVEEQVEAELAGAGWNVTRYRRRCDSCRRDMPCPESALRPVATEPSPPWSCSDCVTEARLQKLFHPQEPSDVESASEP
jgi:hypothetical protein